jgi:hypothetical protein
LVFWEKGGSDDRGIFVVKGGSRFQYQASMTALEGRQKD